MSEFVCVDSGSALESGLSDGEVEVSEPNVVVEETSSGAFVVDMDCSIVLLGLDSGRCDAVVSDDNCAVDADSVIEIVVVV